MDYVIEMDNITKKFGDFTAIDNVSLKVKKGEIHALLGENGAGKSTLMSVLFGLYEPDEGVIKIKGDKVSIKNPTTANELGIGMVHQHFKLVHNFTVLESIIRGHETTKNGFLQMETARKKVMSLSEKYKFNIDPDAVISEITVGMQQRVEILKMLYCDNELLIFDEPTAVLMPQEIDELMKIMKQLVNEGKSIIFITHKLDEIKSVADRCTVLRKGKCINTFEVENATKEEMSEMMVGRKINFTIEKKPCEPENNVLEVNNLVITLPHTSKSKVNNISFKVRRGEIVCIAGIDGNGQSELVYGITGLIPVTSGSILLNGEDITRQTIRNKCIKGISHIPEDRHKYGLVLDFTLEQNIILQTYYTNRFEHHGFLKFPEIRKYTDGLIQKYDIRSGQGAKSVARGMSGGNQQKAIIARELDRNPQLIIAVQPVRGLDVGAIEYIHSQLLKQRDEGKAILLISLELDEVMNMSDRILVMHEGQIVADVKPEEVTISQLGLYMAGTGKDDDIEK